VKLTLLKPVNVTKPAEVEAPFAAPVDELEHLEKYEAEQRFKEQKEEEKRCNTRTGSLYS
jgi:hypothetical protein